jgi:hypothetical protein
MNSSRREVVGLRVATLLLLVVAGTALAQDVVKVSTETHKVLLENHEDRVLDVRPGPTGRKSSHALTPATSSIT